MTNKFIQFFLFELFMFVLYLGTLALSRQSMHMIDVYGTIIVYVSIGLSFLFSAIWMYITDILILKLWGK